MPPNGVLTPLALLTAVLEKDPVVGMDWTKDPSILQTPRATISWLASTCLPPAGKGKGNELSKNTSYLQNAFAIAIDSKIAIMGMMMIADPSWLTMSVKVMSSSGIPCPVALAGIEKGGSCAFGIPASIEPVRVKVQLSLLVVQILISGSRKAEITRQRMTTRAFRAVQMNQTVLSTMNRAFSGILFMYLWIGLDWSPDIGLNQPVLFRACRKHNKSKSEYD